MYQTYQDTWYGLLIHYTINLFKDKLSSRVLFQSLTILVFYRDTLQDIVPDRFSFRFSDKSINCFIMAR